MKVVGQNPLYFERSDVLQSCRKWSNRGNNGCFVGLRGCIIVVLSMVLFLKLPYSGVPHCIRGGVLLSAFLELDEAFCFPGNGRIVPCSLPWSADAQFVSLPQLNFGNVSDQLVTFASKVLQKCL